MSGYDNIIIKIQNILSKTHHVPVFEPFKWRKLFNNTIHANCYAYALNMNIPDKNEEVFIPGCISNKNAAELRTTHDIVNAVIKDLDFLGIKYRIADNSTVCNSKEYRIAIYSAPSVPKCPLNFHFARQDCNGEWSEKKGWTGDVQKIGKRGNTPPTFGSGYKLLKVLIIAVV